MSRSTASLWSLTLLLSGCAPLFEKLNDPAVADTTAHLGQNLQKIGDATGFPYAGAALAAGGMILYLLFGAGSNTKKKEPA